MDHLWEDTRPLSLGSGSDNEADDLANSTVVDEANLMEPRSRNAGAAGYRRQENSSKSITSSAVYSEICYAETHGKVSYADTPGSSVNRYSPRKTRLRISYRRNLNTNDIQFILIIYEDIKKLSGAMYKPNARCNLMAKMARLVSEEDLNNTGAGDGMGRIVDKKTSPLSGRVSPYEEGIVSLLPENEDKNEDDVALKRGTECTTTPIRRTIEATTLYSSAFVVSPETHIFPEDLKMLEDLNNADNSLDYSMSQLRTPTKLRPSPFMTPVRKPRSTSRKRATSPILEPTPKRSAARSLRL